MDDVVLEDDDGRPDDDHILEVTAGLELYAASRSGFAWGQKMGSGYELSGPLVGPASRDVPRHPAALWAGADDLPELIWDLDGGVYTWCAALFDDGRIVLANNRGASHIPMGKHLPNNAAIVTGDSEDGVYWRAFGCDRPAERIVLYGQHFGWLDRITKMVAGTVKVFTGQEPAVRWDSPFAWARPMMGDHATAVEFVEVDSAARFRDGFRMYYDGRSFDPDYHPWGSPRRGGLHRLAVVAPHHYARLEELVTGDDHLMVRAAVQSAAELTVTAAQRAVAYSEGAYTSVMQPFWADAMTVLELVAATDPAVIADRRLSNAAAACSAVELPESMGLPGYAASEWAALTDAVYCRALPLVGTAPSRFDGPADQGVADEQLREVACRMVLMQALEAIGLWNADPLPVADIEYAARYAANRW